MHTPIEISVENKNDWAKWLGEGQADLNAQLAKSLGIPVEFLTGEDIPDNMSGDSFAGFRAATLGAITDKIMWNYCAMTANRKGVIVHVWKPEMGIHNFRSLRTAKVWNKRRLQSAKA